MLQQTYYAIIAIALIVVISANAHNEDTDKVTCSKNETFQTSGYDCQTCSRLIVKCAEVFASKCYCNPGYVRDDKTGNCILHDECKEQSPPPCSKGGCHSCGENEEYRLDGADCATCWNYMFVKCAPQPIPGCYCVSDPYHVRGKNRRCVATEDCKDEILFAELD